ncbi:protein kinase [Gemmatimonadota bacterium]
MIGKTIDRYKIVDKLGEGGMGSVWKAEDSKLNRLVALKTLAPHLAENEEARERFTREAQAASALNHPNITTIHDLLDIDDQHFICMEYVEGKTIKDLLETGQVSVRKAVDIILQTADALETAHRKGILHRDVKSANIMISMEGNVKVMDFGLAHLEERSQLTRTGTMMGTLAYTSPEQLTGRTYDESSEIWSLGVVFYELLTGQLPFRSPSEGELVFAIINNEQVKPSQLREDVPVSIDSVIIRMLDKDPTVRFLSMGDVINELQGIRRQLETSTIGSVTTAEQMVSLRKKGLTSWLVRVGIVAIVAVLAAVVISVSTPKLDPSLILITVLENRSNESSLDLIGHLICQEVINRINYNSEFASAVDYDTVYRTSSVVSRSTDTSARSDLYRELALDRDAGVILVGGYMLGIGRDTLQVTLTLQNTRTRRPIGTFPVIKVGLDDTTATIVSICNAIVGVLPQQVDNRFSAVIPQSGSIRSTEAQTAFTRGLEEYFWGGGTRAALSQFSRATEIDSLFLTAQLWVSRMFSAGIPDTAAMDSVLGIVSRHSDRLSLKESLIFEYSRAYLAGNREECFRITSELAERYGGIFHIADAAQNARLARRPQQALELFSLIKPEFNQKVCTVGGWIAFTNQYIRTLHMLDRDRQARKLTRSLVASNPTPIARFYYAVTLHCRSLAHLGKVEELIRVLDESLPESQLIGQLQVACKISFVDGREEDVSRLAAHGIEKILSRREDGTVTPSESYIHAELLFLLGRYEEAELIYREVLSMQPDHIGARRGIGICCANTGDLDEAIKMVEWFADQSPRYPQVIAEPLSRISIASHLGDFYEAESLLADYVVFDPYNTQFYDRAYLKPLWGNPVYEASLRSR